MASERKYLWELKNIGHNLFDEYVALCIAMGLPMTRKRAYLILEKRLGHKQSAHYSSMATREEILRANNALRSMILKQINLDKKKVTVHFAPNLKEIQQQANNLNPQLA